MRQKSGPQKPTADKAIKDIRRVTRKSYSAEEKIRIVLEGLRREPRMACSTFRLRHKPCQMEATLS